MQLEARLGEIRTRRPTISARDAALELGVAEAEVATLAGAHRLNDDVASLLFALREVGRCIAVTRNDHAILEVTGLYSSIAMGARACTVSGDRIELRAHLPHWHQLFAVEDTYPQQQPCRSVQVFDRSGTAIHKMYLSPKGDARTWDAIISNRIISTKSLLIADRTVEKYEEEIARTSTVGAPPLAGEDHAHAVRRDAIDHVLHEAHESGEELSIVVGNRGCEQTFTGAMKHLVRQGQWLNVIDPDLSFHVNRDRIASSWVVTEPSSKASSLELFDAHGNPILSIRHARGENAPLAWTQFMKRLPRVRR